ncbi:MAG TPA: hypothetical protein VJ600_02015 [Holophagaceae bacterium]|nr:hypothetical protein [Holophagaceae bacterium]
MPFRRLVPALLLALPLAGQAEARKEPGLAPLFTAFRAYQRNPGEQRTALLAALPRTPAGRRAYVALGSVPGAEQPTTSGQPGLWEIQDAVLDLARKGDSRAIGWILALSGEGEGHVREGLGRDALDLFKEPRLVAEHWPLFRPHRASLKHLKTWTYEENYPAIRAGYAQAFADRPALRDELLALLDAPE